MTWIFTLASLLLFSLSASAASEVGDSHSARIQLLGTLFTMFVAAKVGAELFERFHQPAVVGEILAGILIGPSLFDWVRPDVTTETLSEIGVILLMFTVGLETEPRQIFEVGKDAFRVAILGVLFPFILGAGALLFLAPLVDSRPPFVPAVFVGAAMVATSVGITARVLADLGRLNSRAARIILAAAVIDDILALLVLATVSGLAKGSGINWRQIGVTAGLAFALVAFMTLLAPRLLSWIAPWVQKLRVRDAQFVGAMALCLGLALLSEAIGIAAIIGAFLAGMVLAERTEQSGMLHKTEPLVNLFLPFFLVNIGMQLKLDVFRDPKVIFVALIVTLLAIGGKFAGGMLGAKSLGETEARQVGMGMVPRGEVGIVAAQLGLGLGALNQNLFAVVLFMAVATTLIAPPFLRRLFAAPSSSEGLLSEGDLVVEAQPFRVE